MNDLVAYVIIVLYLMWCSAWYVFGRFHYWTEGDLLRLRWRMFRYLPVGSRKIKLGNIAEERLINWRGADLWRGAYIFGNFFRGRGSSLG